MLTLMMADAGRRPAAASSVVLPLPPPLILIRPVGKAHSKILDPQGPVPRKMRWLAASKTLARRFGSKPCFETGP